MIVGLLGQAGSGKDATADFMVKNHGFVKVAFADPLKRICRDVFQFSKEQLWGPSEKRNAPDPRWPHGAQSYRDAAEREFRLGIACAKNCATWRDHAGVIEHFTSALQYADEGWLTPRRALQRLGTEWGRYCSPDIWVEYALRTADTLLKNPGGNPLFYDPMLGIRSRYVSDPEVGGVVISDVRFRNETKKLQGRGAKVVRIVRKERPLLNNPGGLRLGERLPETLEELMATAVLLSASASAHVSETEQKELPDELFDHHLLNGGDSLELLEAAVAGLVDTIRG